MEKKANHSLVLSNFPPLPDENEMDDSFHDSDLDLSMFDKPEENAVCEEGFNIWLILVIFV